MRKAAGSSLYKDMLSFPQQLDTGILLISPYHVPGSWTAEGAYSGTLFGGTAKYEDD